MLFRECLRSPPHDVSRAGNACVSLRKWLPWRYRLKRFLLLECCSFIPVSPTVYHPHPNPQGGSSSADSWLLPDALNQSLWGLGARGPHLRGAPTLGPPAPEASPPAWRALPPSSPAAKPGPQRGAGTGLGGKTSPASSSGTPGVARPSVFGQKGLQEVRGTRPGKTRVVEHRGLSLSWSGIRQLFHASALKYLLSADYVPGTRLAALLIFLSSWKDEAEVKSQIVPLCYTHICRRGTLACVFHAHIIYSFLDSCAYSFKKHSSAPSSSGVSCGPAVGQARGLGTWGGRQSACPHGAFLSA